MLWCVSVNTTLNAAMLTAIGTVNEMYTSIFTWCNLINEFACGVKNESAFM